jgi:hypothetical protein
MLGCHPARLTETAVDARWVERLRPKHEEETKKKSDDTEFLTTPFAAE